jgi:hypothetical protein
MFNFAAPRAFSAYPGVASAGIDQFCKNGFCVHADEFRFNSSVARPERMHSATLLAKCGKVLSSQKIVV